MRPLRVKYPGGDHRRAVREPPLRAQYPGGEKRGWFSNCGAFPGREGPYGIKRRPAGGSRIVECPLRKQGGDNRGVGDAYMRPAPFAQKTGAGDILLPRAR